MPLVVEVEEIIVEVAVLAVFASADVSTDVAVAGK